MLMIITNSQYGFTILQPSIRSRIVKDNYGDACFYDSSGILIEKEENVYFRKLPITMTHFNGYNYDINSNSSCYFERVIETENTVILELYSCRLKKFATLEVTEKERESLSIRQIFNSTKTLFVIYFSNYNYVTNRFPTIEGNVFSENGFCYGKYRDIFHDFDFNEFENDSKAAAFINQYKKIVRIGDVYWTEPNFNFVDTKGRVLLHLNNPPHEIEKHHIFYKSDAYNKYTSEKCYLIEDSWISENACSVSIYSSCFKKIGSIPNAKISKIYQAYPQMEEPKIRLPFLVTLDNRIYSFSGKLLTENRKYEIMLNGNVHNFHFFSWSIGQHQYYFLTGKLENGRRDLYLLKGTTLELLFPDCCNRDRPEFVSNLITTNKTTGIQEKKNGICINYEKNGKLFHEIYIVQENLEKTEIDWVKIFSYCLEKGTIDDPFCNIETAPSSYLMHPLRGDEQDEQNFIL